MVCLPSLLYPWNLKKARGEEWKGRGRSAYQSDLTRPSCGAGPARDAAVLRDKALLSPCEDTRRQPLFGVPPRIPGGLEDAGCSSAMHSKGKNVPAVGNLSRAIRLLTSSSGFTVPVSTRAKEHCNAPRNSRPAAALCRRTPAPRRRQEAQHRQERPSFMQTHSGEPTTACMLSHAAVMR